MNIKESIMEAVKKSPKARLVFNKLGHVVRKNRDGHFTVSSKTKTKPGSFRHLKKMINSRRVTLRVLSKNRNKVKSYRTLREFLDEMTVSMKKTKHLDEMPDVNTISGNYRDFFDSEREKFQDPNKQKIGSYVAPNGLHHVYHNNGFYSISRSDTSDILRGSVSLINMHGMPHARTIGNATSAGGVSMHLAYPVILKHLKQNGVTELHGTDQSVGAQKLWQKLSRNKNIHMHLHDLYNGKTKPLEKNWNDNYKDENKDHSIVARLK